MWETAPPYIRGLIKPSHVSWTQWTAKYGEIPLCGYFVVLTVLFAVLALVSDEITLTSLPKLDDKDPAPVHRYLAKGLQDYHGGEAEAAREQATAIWTTGAANELWAMDKAQFEQMFGDRPGAVLWERMQLDIARRKKFDKRSRVLMFLLGIGSTSGFLHLMYLSANKEKYATELDPIFFCIEAAVDVFILEFTISDIRGK